MAILDVEGSKFTKQLTGRHLVVWLMFRYSTTQAQAYACASEDGEFFVRMDDVTRQDFKVLFEGDGLKEMTILE